MPAPPQAEGSTPEPQESMAQLLGGQTSYPHLRRGDIVEGTIVGFSREGVLVDLGAKTEGVIPRSEMTCLGPGGEASLKVGDQISVFVLRPETAEGQILLSLDRARGEQGWQVLQERQQRGEAFQAPVVGHNRGGLILNAEGVRAFLPVSQLAPDPELPTRDLSRWVGRWLTVKVLELNRRRGRAILSQRAALEEQRTHLREQLLQELQEGQVRRGRVTSVRDFGIFVDLGGIEGLVPVSELSWEPTPPPPHSVCRVGDEVEVFVMRIDQDTGRVSLSLRRAQGEQWEAIVASLKEGDVLPGLVTKLTNFGAFVRLGGRVEGLIHISELAERHLQHPGEVVQEGDIVPVKVLRIERERRRLSLSLRQARDEAEAQGWAFDQNGAVVFVPPEVRAAVQPQNGPQGE